MCTWRDVRSLKSALVSSSLSFFVINQMIELFPEVKRCFKNSQKFSNRWKRQGKRLKLFGQILAIDGLPSCLPLDLSSSGTCRLCNATHFSPWKFNATWLWLQSLFHLIKVFFYRLKLSGCSSMWDSSGHNSGFTS